MGLHQEVLLEQPEFTVLWCAPEDNCGIPALLLGCYPRPTEEDDPLAAVEFSSSHRTQKLEFENATVRWQEVDGRLQAVHIHFSNP
jgi:hypothetical protein